MPLQVTGVTPPSRGGGGTAGQLTTPAGLGLIRTCLLPAGTSRPAGSEQPPSTGQDRRRPLL